MKTTDQFIADAKTVHGDKYDYNETVYFGASAKINIICKEHGPFQIYAKGHLSGRGCPYCKGKMSLDIFKKRAAAIHNNYYCYDNVCWKNSSTPVEIVCPKHGSFFQDPRSHLAGHGCAECYKDRQGDDRKLTAAEFKAAAVKVHGDRYNYDKVLYSSYHDEITICCKEHGEFQQIVAVHLSGSGCPKCGKQKASDKQRMTFDDFVARAETIHDGYYTYPAQSWTKALDKVTVICPKHGKFNQRAAAHLDGQGCPKCSRSQGEIAIAKWLQLHNIVFEEQKRFSDCKYKKRLSFDFFISDKNTAIEFQGVQHQQPVEHFGGDESFQEQKRRDSIKRQYCETNSIRLIEVYSVEEIDSKLQALL